MQVGSRGRLRSRRQARKSTVEGRDVLGSRWAGYESARVVTLAPAEDLEEWRRRGEEGGRRRGRRAVRSNEALDKQTHDSHLGKEDLGRRGRHARQEPWRAAHAGADLDGQRPATC